MLGLLVFLQFHLIYSSKIKTAQYKIHPAINVTSVSAACVYSCTDNVYVSVRKHDVTGACEGLDYDSENLVLESGYTYYLKKRSTDVFDPPRDLYYNPQWLIPGYFRPGSKLEFYITMPTGSWDGFKIDMVDTIAGSYDVYDNVPEIIMVHLLVLKGDDKVLVKGSKGASWTNFGAIPNPFEDGETYKISIIPDAERMKVCFDDIEAASFLHLTPPEMARQLFFNPFSAFSFFLNNISVTFAGI